MDTFDFNEAIILQVLLNFQTSPESPGIFVLLQKLFRGQSAAALKQAAEAPGLSEDEFKVSFCSIY